MTTPAVTPQGDAFDQLATPPGTPPPVPAAGTNQGDVFDQLAAGKTPQASDSTSSDPSVTGEITNDVGNKVIVPKQGEEFADTMKRAVLYHRSLSPEQQEAAINKEQATIPKKALQAGIGGPIAVAGVTGLGMLGINELLGPSMKLQPVRDAIGQIARDARGRLLPWVEQEGPSLAKQGARHVVQFVSQHPLATAFAYHIAREIGIPLPKILDVISKVKAE